MREAPVFTSNQLVGRSRDHLTDLLEPPLTLHREVATPFLALRAAAAADGIDLVAFSGFRDFDRQRVIWNGKFRGERPLQDRAGQPLDALALTPHERVEAILWWSALPGASRHHWGTDLDVMDAAAVPAGYRLQVIPAEYGPAGPFARLSAWLDAHMHDYGFFRPYTHDRGGVRPEPWHISYAPVAVRAGAALSPACLRETLASADIEGKAEVLAGLERYFATYVANVDEPPAAARLSPRLS